MYQVFLSLRGGQHTCFVSDSVVSMPANSRQNVPRLEQRLWYLIFDIAEYDRPTHYVHNLLGGIQLQDVQFATNRVVNSNLKVE